MRSVIYIIGGLLLAMNSLSSWAVVSCTPVAGMPRVDTVQLSPPIISAGADIPIGTVIYQGRWHAGETFAIGAMCNGTPNESFWYNVTVMIRSAPLPLSSWSGSPFGGAVYNTNIPGIGVAISIRDKTDAATLGSPIYSTDISATAASDGTFAVRMANNKLSVSLIKTGPISPGNYSLDSSQLPSFGIDLTNPRGYAAIAGFPIKAHTVRLQGQLTVTSQTCTTPDVPVSLGSYEKGVHFKGINSTTPWIDASISMTNCPTFHGFYNLANPTLMFEYYPATGTGTGTLATSTNNSIGVRLTPAGDVVDAANGIMAIDTTVPGAASGVGIQIGWGLSSQTPTPFNFATEQVLTLPKDGSSTIRVPLAARYIQTTANPTPGKANGKLTFTINYY
ncbi:fimbrial protein [Serratia sp. L9]|uniref:fimbrial protein n=1 Tax=Serratia sp. L9 TaxID=3423946 RepID=UPI003D66839F